MSPGEPFATDSTPALSSITPRLDALATRLGVKSVLVMRSDSDAMVVAATAGTLEPFFLENATRWADALRGAGADVVMTERMGSHGDAFWQQELPLMVDWAFRR
jgi:S-formylglutathione hydrolase FrmB